MRHLGGAGDYAQGNRSTKDLKVVVVDLVFEPHFANLIESAELVEIDRISIWHDEPMEDNGHAPLLPEPCTADLLCLAEYLCAFRDKNALMIVGIERLRDHRDDWTRRIAVKLVDQNGVEEGTLVDYIRLAGGAVYVDLYMLLFFRLVFLRFGGSFAAW